MGKKKIACRFFIGKTKGNLPQGTPNVGGRFILQRIVEK
jgi:hypothetical protein